MFECHFNLPQSKSAVGNKRKISFKKISKKLQTKPDLNKKNTKQIEIQIPK